MDYDDGFEESDSSDDDSDYEEDMDDE